MNIQYEFLEKIDLTELLSVNLEAFSDYVVPISVTFEQFENHIAQNNIDLKLSVGAFSEGRLVGYTLNGFGIWNGKKTVYDGGTGVIPEFRRKGIGKSMFEFMIPELQAKDFKQILLEVISSNQKAINLYRKLGFLETRRLLFFEQTSSIDCTIENEIEIRKVKNLDWSYIQKFWDQPTSWQFSVESVQRKLSSKLFFAVYTDDKLIGYSILYPKSGVIPQIAVDRNYRGNKAATMLLAEMQKHLDEEKRLRFSNVDRDLVSLIRFAGKLHFTPTISQFEMILDL